MLFTPSSVNGQIGLLPPLGYCCSEHGCTNSRSCPCFQFFGLCTRKGPSAFVVWMIPFSAGDCWNQSLAPCPSDAAFVFHPSPFAHGKVLGVPRPGFVTSWRAILSLIVVLSYEDLPMHPLSAFLEFESEDPCSSLNTSTNVLWPWQFASSLSGPVSTFTQWEAVLRIPPSSQRGRAQWCPQPRNQGGWQESRAPDSYHVQFDQNLTCPETLHG